MGSQTVLPKIFVSIPSLYDTELIPTVLNAFDSAEFPERVVVGVSLMDDNKRLLKVFKKATANYANQIKLKFTKVSYKNATTILNVGYGRKQASDLYSDEDYMLQCDSHTYLDEHWDSKLIGLFEEAKKELGFEKFVLTAYAGRYAYQNGIRCPIEGDDSSRYPFYISHRWLSRYTPSWIDEKPDVTLKFVPCTKFNANFTFGDKKFAMNTGVFEKAVFFEEEPIQSINLREDGFKLVFPMLDKSIVYHLYATNDEDVTLGFRRTGYSYLSPKQMADTEKRNWDNWRDFIYDPANFDKVKRYEQYCGASMRYGVFNPHYIPTTY